MLYEDFMKEIWGMTVWDYTWLKSHNVWETKICSDMSNLLWLLFQVIALSEKHFLRDAKIIYITSLQGIWNKRDKIEHFFNKFWTCLRNENTKLEHVFEVSKQELLWALVPDWEKLKLHSLHKVAVFRYW